jgi:hypothetical protein
MAKVLTLHPVTLNTTQIDGIYQVVPTDGVEVLRPLSDGNVDPYLAMVGARTPGATWATYNLKAALDLVGISAFNTGDAELWDALRNVDGSRATGGAVKVTLANAVTMPRSISAAQDGPATMTLQSWGVGTTPVTVQTSQNVSAFTPGSATFYGLGPALLNGSTALVGLQSVNVDFGLQEFVLRTDGDVTPKQVVIQARQPSITLVCIGDTARGLVAAGGTVLNGTTGLRVVLRKRSATGFVANATAEHIIIQAKNGVVTGQQTDGDPRAFTLRCDISRTNADAPLIISTASAVPT